jgi:hypothetical protein
MRAILATLFAAFAITAAHAAERVDCDGFDACLAWFNANAGTPAAKLKALTDFMAAHETDEARWKAAQDVIRQAGEAGASMVQAWQRRALDSDESSALRIAALRGLEALGAHAAAAREPITALANDEDPEIREAARTALKAFDEPRPDAPPPA